MTHEELYRLKFSEGISTYELMQRFPNDVKAVTEVAMIDIPEDILREVLKEEHELDRLLKLKKLLKEKEAIQNQKLPSHEISDNVLQEVFPQEYEIALLKP